jgi:hypothetical protein
MDVKRKTCHIRTWEKHLSLDISSTLIDTHVRPIALPVRLNPQQRSLSAVVSATSAPPFHLFVISETFVTKIEPLYATNTSDSKQETFLYGYTRTLFFAIFTTEISL